MSDEQYKSLVDGVAPPAHTSADDMVLQIATGRSVHARRWSTEAMSFSDFKKRLQRPFRSLETVADYEHMSAVKRLRLKDVGGYIGGPVSGDGRTKGAITSRTLLTMDLDHATPALLDAPESGVHFAAVMHSTHSHTPAAPRVRLIAPLSRAVSADEYDIVARQVARDIGDTMVDPCSYVVNQLMFWPSCPRDGEYYYREISSPVLDVDEVIARAAAHTMTSLIAPSAPLDTLPSIPASVAPIRPQDPRTKCGVIGAFCRAYTVSAAIAAYLSDCYRYEGRDGPSRTRYTWTRGEGARGLIVYDDMYAYSHHGTDPAHDGHVQSAFDLVCVHRYGGDTKSAVRELGKNPAVIRVLDDERANDFRPEVDVRDTSAPDWRLQLERGECGDIKPTITNCKLILETDTRFSGFAVDELAGSVEVTAPMLWSRPDGVRAWRDADRDQLISVLDKLYAHFSPRTVDIAFSAVADNRRYNPLKNWLESLPPWDEVPRIDTLLSRCLGADQSDYTAAAMRKTLLAAVARVYKPGIKFDYVTVLDGPQGIGKSTFWRLLVGDDRFTDALTIADMSDAKKAGEKLQGRWIAELAELAGMSKADIRAMRSFITRQNDDYRAAYARVLERRPRLTILVGTVNGGSRGYLRDLEGNRRFWPVTCKDAADGAAAVWAALKHDRSEIWAEALQMYKTLCGDDDALAAALQMDTPALQAAALLAQSAAIEVDDRAALVGACLDTPILEPDKWSRLTIEERAAFMRGKTYAISSVDVHSARRVRRDRVCLLEVYAECLGGDIERYDKRKQLELYQVMQSLGDRWQKSGRRVDFGPYGRGVEYVRIDAADPGEPTSGDDDDDLL